MERFIKGGLGFIIWKVTWSQGKAIRCNHTLGLGWYIKRITKGPLWRGQRWGGFLVWLMLIPCPQACYSLPTNLWWSCAGQFSGSLKEPSYETTSWCESVLSWPEVLRALGQNVKIIGGWVDGDGDHHPAPSHYLTTTKSRRQISTPGQHVHNTIPKRFTLETLPKIPQQIHVVWLAGLIW